MRKELKIIGSRERHVFTATFIRFGFRDGYKGPVKTILLQDVLMGILEENKTFISSRPGCILYRLDEMESWAYLDDLLP